MQRESKSVHLGAALFLCLGLAIIPVSLQVAGVPLTLSPRLAAALEVWGQITDAFEGSYQNVAQPELATAQAPESDPSITADGASGHSEFACSRGSQTEALLPPQSAAPVQRSGNIRRRCAGATQPKAIERALTPNTREVMIRAHAFDAALISTMSALEGLRSLKSDAAVHLEWSKAVEKELRLRGIELRRRARNGEIPEAFKVLVRVKPPVASNSAAACKVQTAMAAATRLDLQRAGLFNDQPSSAEFCEF